MMCLLEESQGHLSSQSTYNPIIHYETRSTEHKKVGKDCTRLATVIIVFLSQSLVFCGYCHAETISPDSIENGFTSVYSTKETIPAFPKCLPGWRQTPPGRDFWGEPAKATGTVRVVKGSNQWTEIPGFTASQNDCNTGLFLVRWETQNPDVAVDSGLKFVAAINKVKSGSFGFLGGTNCHEPIFRFNTTKDGNASINVDISYEVRFYDTTMHKKY